MHSLIKYLALAAAVTAKVIDIDVGEDGIKFSPSSTTAKVGDTLAFHFYSAVGPHSVVRASFDSPCVPSQDAFFSGLLQGSDDGNAEVFEVKVTSEDPIWFYCSAKKHCQNGMVGVINPPSGSSIDDFASAAKGVAAASAPASPTGGTSTSLSGGSDDSGSSSTSAPAASATSEASTTPTITSGGASSEASSATSKAASVASSASSKASSVASGATSSPSPTTGAAINRDGKAAAALAVVAGGLVALMA